MYYKLRGMILAGAMVLAANAAMADTFGTGANQFNIDFVPISGATNPSSGIPAGDGFTFTGVNNDYRMGKFEITNDQWNKFTAAYGTVTGYPYDAYNDGPLPFRGLNVPADFVSWYEAAQFTNWLNTSTGHQAAYKFTGTQGMSDYTFADWSATDTGYDASNPYRNKAAKYYLPTENEWLKAAYWNGTTLQTWATIGDVFPTQGNGTGTGWNYNNNAPWNVGSGSQELNGTHDMMGNVWEAMESPWTSGDYNVSSSCGTRGGGWGHPSANSMAASVRYSMGVMDEYGGSGFRVASVPEPGSLIVLAGIALTALLYWWRKRA